MCTLTYLPVGDKIIITQSRDESPVREAIKPAVYHYKNCELSFPKDVQSQGSWMVSNQYDRVSSLLNGGLEKHVRKTPYAKSRGLVHLDLYTYSSIQEFAQEYDLQGIEPFTLVAVEQGGKSLYQLVWTGQVIYLKQIDPSQPMIWSSTTLYDEASRKLRAQWFEDYLLHKVYSAEQMIHFHTHTHTDDESINIWMNRNEKVMTTSITQCIIEKNSVIFSNFIAREINKKSL
jgi:hypothetical protein